MKKIYLIGIIILACLITPQLYSQNIGDLKGIYYQAVAIDEYGQEIVGTDIEGKPLYEKTISVRFSITKGLNGPIQFEETHETTTDKYGLFSLTIGQGTQTGNGTYTKLLDIPWIDADQFLKVEISSKNDGNYRLVSNHQFMTVPYSFYTDDIADNAITSAKILNSTIVNEDIADNTINLKTKVTDSLSVTNGGTGKNFLQDGSILVGSGSEPVKPKKLASTDATVIITQTADTINLQAVSAPVLVTSDPAGTFNIPNIANGATYVSNAINYAGVDFGDIIIASIDQNLQGCMLTAYVSQQNVIRVAIFNGTGGTVNFGLDVSLRVFVIK
ncbi:MAG: hypothetical protein F9K37_03685 [Bacteroidales bacterium]|nr:MAG: hypothetical protein F9K37_03685 [Bacteroidales bacterium]